MTDVEGLDSVDSFANRTTSQVREDIKSMQRAPDPNNPNATIGITAREAMTIHRISKYGKLLILVQRTYTPALGTIPNLLCIGQFYDENPDLMEGDSYPLPPHSPKMENIESWACTAYGYCGICLDYIFRENSELPVVGDPGFLRADDGSRSIKEELVQILVLCSVATTRNFGLCSMPSHMKPMPTIMGHFTNELQAAVRVLATLHWNGKARGFTWNTFISRLIGAFNNLKLNRDPRSDAIKVDVLLEKTVGDSSLSNGRSHITGDAILRSNFQGAIDYLTTQVLAAGNNNLLLLLVVVADAVVMGEVGVVAKEMAPQTACNQMFQIALAAMVFY
ncbi:unnamed protein product [Cylindrotheca closterium]|uniref:Uncharacterized protein n=1 Tax=Cylindrotheca closterium TaxID=2856 RepID=A0AAD2FSW9_9STRA|nr:unnamed protein product [Cylindrotheca closterium]